MCSLNVRIARFCWLLSNLLFSVPVQGQCYLPGPILATDHLPCEPYAYISSCCQSGYTCFDNGLCAVTDPNSNVDNVTVGAAARGACTHPTFGDVCASFCQDDPIAQNDGSVISCGDQKWCCEPNAAAGTCNCETGEGTFSLQDGVAQTIIGVDDLIYTNTDVIPIQTSIAAASATGGAASSMLASASASASSPYLAASPTSAASPTLPSASASSSSQQTSTAAHSTMRSSVSDATNTAATSAISSIPTSSASVSITTATISATGSASPTSLTIASKSTTPSKSVIIGVSFTASAIFVLLAIALIYCIYTRRKRQGRGRKPPTPSRTDVDIPLQPSAPPIMPVPFPDPYNPAMSPFPSQRSTAQRRATQSGNSLLMMPDHDPNRESRPNLMYPPPMDPYQLGPSNSSSDRIAPPAANSVPMQRTPAFVPDPYNNFPIPETHSSTPPPSYPSAPRRSSMPRGGGYRTAQRVPPMPHPRRPANDGMDDT